MPGLAVWPGDLTIAAQAPLDEDAEVLRDMHGGKLLKRGPDLELERWRVRSCGKARMHRLEQILNQLVVGIDISRQPRVVDVVLVKQQRFHAATMPRHRGLSDVGLSRTAIGLLPRPRLLTEATRLTGGPVGDEVHSCR